MYKDDFDLKIKDILMEDREISPIVRQKKEETFKIIYELENKKKNKYTLYNKRIASILLAMLVTFPFGILAISNGDYKYIESENVIIKSNEPIYSLKENKIFYNGGVTITNFTIDILNKNIRISCEGDNINLIPRAELRIGNDKIDISTTVSEGEVELGNTYITSLFNGNFNYNDTDEIKYTVFSDDGNDYSIDIELEEVRGVYNYEKLGRTDTNVEIPITAIINDTLEPLSVDFKSEAYEDGMSIMAGNNNIYSGIYLIDKNGKSVEGVRNYRNGYLSYNIVYFNTSGLIKPFSISVDNVCVTPIDKVISSNIITLDIPKKNGTVDINRKIELDENSNNISNQNNLVFLENITKSDNELKVSLSFPDNNSSNIKISSIFTDYLDGSFGNKEIVESNKCTISFNLDDIVEDKVAFKLCIGEYYVEGEEWNYTIK